MLGPRMMKSVANAILPGSGPAPETHKVRQTVLCHLALCQGGRSTVELALVSKSVGGDNRHGNGIEGQLGHIVTTSDQDPVPCQM